MVKDKVVNYSEAYRNCVEYFKGDTLAAEVFLSKYAMRNDRGELLELTPDEMHRRMAKEFARIENKFGGEGQLSEREIYEVFKDFKYIIPGGSVMSGLGNPNYVGSLSNCFVIGQCGSDSYASIMKYRDFQIEVSKRRGGVGKDLSNLRPSGTHVNNSARYSTGPVSFMNVDSELTREVAQGGRRGALMISLSCKHPDVEDFIVIKQDLSKVTGANISVKFSDDFLTAVENNDKYILRWPVDLTNDEVNELLKKENIDDNEKHWFNDNKVCLKIINAKEVWDKFIHCAWQTAEPGIMYEDRHHNYSPDGVYDEYRGITSNPCGEIFMGKFDSCRLMNINLSSFIKNPYTNNAYLDKVELQRISSINMRLCDDLVELELEHIEDIIKHIKTNYNDDNANELELWEKIYKTGKGSRRAGCGATGLCDALAKLGIKVRDAEDCINNIFSLKEQSEFTTSVELAKERGAFEGFDILKEVGYKPVLEKLGYEPTIEKYGKNEYFQHLLDTLPDEVIKQWVKFGRRNVSWSTMAPTGSVSIMSQTTSGVEPLFSPYYRRRRKITSDGDRVDVIDESGEKFTEFLVIHQPFKEWIIKFCNNYDSNLKFEEQASDENLNMWFQKSPWYSSTASEIDPIEHVKMQSIIQKYTSHSISKTCNLPESSTESDINKLYFQGWKMGCKGLTVYRDNCRNGILVKKNNDDCGCTKIITHDAPKRPKILKCDIKRFRNGGEKWIACIGLYGGVPYEIFTGLEEKLGLPYYVTEGEIIKNKIDREVVDEYTGDKINKKVSRYDIRYTNNRGEKITIEGLSHSFKDIYNNYSKLISGLCRHGMPLDYIVSTIKNLTFDNNNINSWKNGVIRAFKPYLKNGEIEGEVCPECGGKIIRENGCKRCSQCSWSACG